MLKNYLKVAWRNLLRNRIFSFINGTGLAVGLGCFLLIALYVLDELSFDRYYDKAGNIYRINTDARWGGQELRMAETSDMMGAILKEEYTQVQEYTRIYSHSGDTKLIRKGNEYITETRAAYVDSTFFNVFAFPALQSFSWWIFLAAGLAALLIALVTVSFQAVRAAMATPVRSLRTE